jgi:hypothetical protein
MPLQVKRLVRLLGALGVSKLKIRDRSHLVSREFPSARQTYWSRNTTVLSIGFAA